MVLTSGDVSFYLITGSVQKVKKWFPGVEMTFALQVEICSIVPCRSVQGWRASVVNTVMLGMGDRIVVFSFDLVKLYG